MIHIQNALCAKNTEVLPLEIGTDTVYKRYNIKSYVDNEGNEGWSYEEDQMSLEEYFRDTIPINQELTEETLGELSLLFANYQEQVDTTLAELSILIGGTE